MIAAASSQEKVDLAKKCGADEGIVYPMGPFYCAGQKALADLFKSVSGPKGFDVVYDPVGGDYAEAALRSMARAAGSSSSASPPVFRKIPLNLPLLKTCQIVGVYSGGFKKDIWRRAAGIPRNCSRFIRRALSSHMSRSIIRSHAALTRSRRFSSAKRWGRWS